MTAKVFRGVLNNPASVIQSDEGALWVDSSVSPTQLKFNADDNSTINVTQAAGVGPSSTTLVATALSAGGTQDFSFAVPGVFCDLQALHLLMSAATTDSSIALYDNETNRDANSGSEDPTDTGLQILITGIDDASAGAATLIESVLGVIKADLDGGVPTLYGIIWNNAGASSNYTLSLEAYPRQGARIA